jgi:hypothetical protein
MGLDAASFLVSEECEALESRGAGGEETIVCTVGIEFTE